jgi:cytochrome d ubiquinol oxidase subunit II
MQTLWFILLGFMLIMYVLLDGFDLGAGAIHLFAARTNAERLAILRAIGPVWDGNEVWLIAAGGTLFFSFPLLYASSFSGFYLPLMIVLWLLMLRGVSIEMRNLIKHPLWASFWDGVFFIGSALLAIFLGAALGNVLRGVPMDTKGVFFEPLWTDFNPFSKTPGILDWYTILTGLFALAILIAHGANFIAVKTEGELNARTRTISKYAWIATVVLTILVTIATFFVQPLVWTNFIARPWGFLFPILAFAGLVGLGYWNVRPHDLFAFLSSGVFIFGMLASAAFGIYPDVLPAVDPANSLTIQNASASLYGQTVGLIWWTIGILLAVVYFVFTYRLFRGKVSMDENKEGYGSA